MKSHIEQGTKGHVAQISISKINSSKIVTLAKAATHNERTGETEKHVDSRRSYFNDMMVGTQGSHFYCDIINRITGRSLNPEEVSELEKGEIRYTDGLKVRKDAVLAFECKCQYPGDLIYANIDAYGKIYTIPAGEEIDTRPTEDGGRGDFLYPANLEEFEKWKQLTLSFVSKRFGGEKNIMQAVCHMDESIPHLHIIGMPVHKDKNCIERLSMKYYLDGKEATAELQSEYAAAVSELGYKRGERKGYNVNYTTATHARTLMGLAISSAPESPEAYEKMVKNMTNKEGMELMQALYLRTAVSEEMAKDVPRLQKIVVKKTETNDKLRKEIQKRDDEIKELKKQVADLSKENQRRECELQGARMYRDKEAVGAYFAYQDKFIDDGARHFDRIGLHVDLDFDGHDDRLQDYVDSDKDGHDDRTESE